MKTTRLDMREIRYRVSRIRSVPALSPGLRRIMEIVAGEVSSPDELESLLHYDPGLAARILSTSNLAWYGFRGKVSSLSNAIKLIGYEQVKAVCLYSLLTEDIGGREAIRPLERERLWKHAFMTVRIASLMAATRPWLSRENACLLGLLHDVGRIAVAAYFPEQYALIRKLARTRSLPEWAVEGELGLSHTLIGKWVGIRWAFPPMLKAVIEFHHEPQKSPAFRPEAKLISLANTIAHLPEYPQYLHDDLARIYCNDLCISVEEWQRYSQRLEEFQSEADQFWNLLM